MIPKLILLPHHKKIFDRLTQKEKAELLDALMQFLNLQEVAPLSSPVLDMAFTILTADVKTEDRRRLTSAQNGKNHVAKLNKKIASNPQNQPNPQNSLIDNKNIIKEEIINKGEDNIQDNNINSIQDNNINSPKKDERNINISSIQKRGSSEILGTEKKTSKESSERIDYGKLLVFFNECMQGKAINPIREITERRKIHIVARAREFGKAAIMTAIEKTAASDYLNGHHGGRPWKADFDWIFLPTKFPRILEGYYDNDNRPVVADNSNAPDIKDGTRLRQDQMDYTKGLW